MTFYVMYYCFVFAYNQDFLWSRQVTWVKCHPNKTLSCRFLLSTAKRGRCTWQRPSVCPFVCAPKAEPLDLRPSSFAWGSILTLARLAMQVKVVGQGQMPKIMFLHGCYLALRSRSKVGSRSKAGIKVKFLAHSGR